MSSEESPETSIKSTPEEKPLLSEDSQSSEVNKSSNNSQINTQEESKRDDNIENQAELSEIETGGTDQPNFEEIITFDHTFLNYRITKICKDRESLQNLSFNLLLSNVFIYSGDLIDFNTLTNLSNTEAIKTIRQRINSYKTQDIQAKKIFIENIPFYIRTVGFQESVELILPIISDLSREKDLIIPSRFFEIFEQFVDEIKKFGDKGYFILKDYIVKLISEFLVNNNNIYKKNKNLVKLISNGLVYLSKYIKDSDKGESILTIAIKMAQDDDDDSKRQTAMNLFGALTPYVDKDLMQLYVIPQVKSLADDISVNVRKEVANQLYNISKNLDKNIFKLRLLPVYMKLSKDTLWMVKKAAAEKLPQITKLCDNEIILKNIIPIFKNFANEENIEVKIAAVETFGEFISLIDKKESNNFIELLEFYTKTVQKFSEKNKKDYKYVLQKCSFNFPAVVDFFGKDNWPKLKQSFILMANDKDEKIKLPLAASIGDIAEIIGGELTEENLLEYVDIFFKSSSQFSELKIKILQNLPKIIKIIPTNNKKNTYLEFIKYMIVNKETKWRKRQIFSKIIGKFNNCFTENIIYRRVFPIAINFCFDDISQVRSSSGKHNSKLILQLLSGKAEYKDKTLIIIKSFAQSIDYKYRQIFIYMCTHLFENETVFNENISELLIDLAYDQIPNVKIILAKFIEKMVNKEKYAHLAQNITVKKIVKILKNDKNKEVLNYMEKIKNVEINDVEVELNKKVNYKFKDNMKFVSNEFGITRNVPLNAIFKESKFGIEKGDNISENKESNETKEKKEKETKETEEKKENIENKNEDDNKEKNEIKQEDKKEESEKKEETEKTEEHENKEETEKKEELENKEETEKKEKLENKEEPIQKEENEKKEGLEAK